MNTINLSENAEHILCSQYTLRDAKGEPCETPDQVFTRLAEGLSGGDRRFRDELWEAMTNLRWFPNTACFFNLGNKVNQLAVCLVMPLMDNLSSIFTTLHDAALAQKAAFGTGFDFSPLRPEGAIINSNNSNSSGPTGFLDIYNSIGPVIKQAIRRGAYSAGLRVDHPSIREWISAKKEENALTSFNIMALLTNKFMAAVDDTLPFDLMWDGEVWETVDARELFHEIAYYMHLNGGLGVLFIDTINQSNTVPHLYEIAMTNPCGEQMLGPWESCCLGYINLAAHVTDCVDWSSLARTIRLGTRCLDNIIDANNFLPEVPQIKEAAYRTRRIGNGPTGLADVFYKLKLPYGGLESVVLAGDLMEAILYHSMLESVELAKERGPFPAILGSVFDPYHFTWEPPDGGKLDWDKVIWSIKQHGIRNAAFTSVAPSQLSTVMDLEGYGCEPVFSLSYVRRLDYKGSDWELHYESSLFAAVLDHAHKDEILREVQESGSCQNVERIPQTVKDVFVTAADVPANRHINIQCALQNCVSGGVSKTINMPKATVVADVEDAIMLAWQRGAKGLTVYRQGSRELEILYSCKTGMCDGEP